jgi:hypothetical protein
MLQLRCWNRKPRDDGELYLKLKAQLCKCTQRARFSLRARLPFFAPALQTTAAVCPRAASYVDWMGSVGPITTAGGAYDGGNVRASIVINAAGDYVMASDTSIGYVPAAGGSATDLPATGGSIRNVMIYSNSIYFNTASQLFLLGSQGSVSTAPGQPSTPVIAGGSYVATGLNKAVFQVRAALEYADSPSTHVLVARLVWSAACLAEFKHRLGL